MASLTSSPLSSAVHPPPLNREKNGADRPSPFHPSVWGDFFISYSEDHKKIDAWTRRVGELKEEVKKMLIRAKGSLEEMIMIDEIQRLGVAYHFEKEINDALEHINDANVDYEDLKIVALRFRLLREEGYNVSSDVLNKFKDKEGNFKKGLSSDVEGLLSLYDAAFYGTHGEDILDEAISFTKAHLSSLITHLDGPLGAQVGHALELPMHKRIARLDARFFISLFEQQKQPNEIFLELAKLDFNLAQSMYRMELKELTRNVCAACFRQFNKLEHLVDHMRTSFHSVHEPMCGICKKHCRSFESLREHLIGPLPKAECARPFSVRGCNLCLTVLDSPNALRIHRGTCQFARTNAGLLAQMARLNMNTPTENEMYNNRRTQGPQVVALACKMVGGGNDGSLDLCAKVCLVDEDENIIFQTYVKPKIPVTNYRYETTGMRPDHLRDAMPLNLVQRRIQDILCNGELLWKIRTKGGKARILVGHGLDHDLDCLGIEYPAHLIRDTAKYPPLMKTSQLSNSLKYLTQAYLGYDIQTGIQEPYEECVASMRLYMRMRSQAHQTKELPGSSEAQHVNNFASGRQKELEKMTPEALLEISRSKYYCWCLDSKQVMEP